MNQQPQAAFQSRNLFGNIISIIFGVLFFAIGFVNTFWGNDPQFGIFIILLSFLFFPPAGRLVKKITGFSLTPLLKLLIGAFIIWAAMGVGELFDKIDMMLADFNL